MFVYRVFVFYQWGHSWAEENNRMDTSNPNIWVPGCGKNSAMAAWSEMFCEIFHKTVTGLIGLCSWAPNTRNINRRRVCALVVCNFGKIANNEVRLDVKIFICSLSSDILRQFLPGLPQLHQMAYLFHVPHFPSFPLSCKFQIVLLISKEVTTVAFWTLNKLTIYTCAKSYASRLIKLGNLGCFAGRVFANIFFTASWDLSTITIVVVIDYLQLVNELFHRTQLLLSTTRVVANTFGGVTPPPPWRSNIICSPQLRKCKHL